MPPNPDTRTRATLIGGIALVVWATLAVLTVYAGKTPPFLIVAISFTIAAAIAVIKWVVRGEDVRGHLRIPPMAWALGVGGLFGYHALIFFALQNAPAVEANLVNYLWPLLIVFFSSFLPGHRLRWFHSVGALMGLAGVVVLVIGKMDGALAFETTHALGFAAAFGAAFVWAAYSVLSRLFAQIPSDAVGAFCAVGAALAFACHLVFEPSVWPQGAEWIAVALLGLGPAGGAFFVWDIGVKRGDIQVLGAASYLVPLMSTLLLIAAGSGAFTPEVAAACALIIGGAALAGQDMLRRRARA
ncbi:MAG: EamA family transporter [Rhodospirillaceae bacterium]